MTTRPGYVWDATASEWVEIGQAAVLAPVKYQATAPSSPATGDIWIESDVDVPSIDSAQFLRWRKTMVGGETSLSGNDDSSLPLGYTPGYEQLYINGVLQVRGQDYTATTGTTVTGLTALVANDVVEIFSAVARTVADVYTQTQSDARFVNKNVNGLNLVVPTSVTGGTLSANGQIAFSSTASLTLDGIFSTTYENYFVELNMTTAANTAFNMILRKSNADLAGTDYCCSYYYTAFRSASAGPSYSGLTSSILFHQSNVCRAVSGTYNILQPFGTGFTHGTFSTVQMDASPTLPYSFVGGFSDLNARSADGFRLSTPSSTMTGTIRIYGYNNGA